MRFYLFTSPVATLIAVSVFLTSLPVRAMDDEPDTVRWSTVNMNTRTGPASEEVEGSTQAHATSEADQDRASLPYTPGKKEEFLPEDIGNCHVEERDPDPRDSEEDEEKLTQAHGASEADQDRASFLYTPGKEEELPPEDIGECHLGKRDPDPGRPEEDVEELSLTIAPTIEAAREHNNTIYFPCLPAEFLESITGFLSLREYGALAGTCHNIRRVLLDIYFIRALIVRSEPELPWLSTDRLLSSLEPREDGLTPLALVAALSNAIGVAVPDPLVTSLKGIKENPYCAVALALNHNHFFTANMVGHWRARIIAALVPLSPEHIAPVGAAISAHADHFFTADMSGFGRAQIIAALVPLLPEQITTIVVNAHHFFTDSMDSSHRAKIITALASFFPEHIAAVGAAISAHAHYFFRENMTNWDRARIIAALAPLSPEHIAAVGAAISAHAHYFFRRSQIIAALVPLLPEQITTIGVNAHHFFTDSMDRSHRAKIITALARFSPKQITTIGVNAHHFFLEGMDSRCRLRIIEALVPLSPEHITAFGRTMLGARSPLRNYAEMIVNAAAVENAELSEVHRAELPGDWTTGGYLAHNLGLRNMFSREAFKGWSHADILANHYIKWGQQGGLQYKGADDEAAAAPATTTTTTTTTTSTAAVPAEDGLGEVSEARRAQLPGNWTAQGYLEHNSHLKNLFRRPRPDGWTNADVLAHHFINWGQKSGLNYLS